MSGSGFDAPPPPPMPPMPPNGGQGGAGGMGGGDAIPKRGLGDLLSAAFTIYKAHAVQLIVVVALIVVPLQFISSLLAGVVFKAKTETTQGFVPVIQPRSLGVIWLSVLVGVVIAVVITAMLQAAVLRAAAQATIGDQVDPSESYKFGFRKSGSVILLSILVSLVAVSVLLVGVLLAFAVRGLGVLVIIAGVVFAVWAGVSLFASVPALVVEDKRGTEAMKRSWNLVKGDFWHVLGTLFVAGVIVGVISGIVGGLGGTNWVSVWVFGSIAKVITAPFTALVEVLLYLDLRARKEGLTASTLRNELNSSG